MKILVLSALVAIALALPVTSWAMTKPQAYAHARACLIANANANIVLPRNDGGGVATWNRPGVHGSTFWTYQMWKTWILKNQVSTVTVYFAGQPGLPKQTKTVVRRCLVNGL